MSTLALATTSSNSLAARESQVMPPPTPYSAVPVWASSMTVRIGTPNLAAGSPDPGGERNPTAPQYTPRGESSSSAMISMVRTLGAPVTDPQGKSGREHVGQSDLGSEHRGHRWR